MTRLDTLVELFPSMYRRQKQINILAETYIPVTDTLQFTQRDVLVGEEYGPLIVMCDTIIGDADIEVTITYDIAQTVDFIIPANSDKDSMYYIPISPYLVSDISYKSGTSDKGTAGDRLSFYNLTGNHAKLLYITNSMSTDVDNIVYEFIRYLVLAEARDDWLDKQALSWGLIRLPAETDADLIKRIVFKSTPTDGTILSVIDRVRSYLGLLPTDSITVTESYNQTGWLLGVSRLLAFGQSELILTGDVPLQPMQFIMNISGYGGSLTEADIEDYLRGIINVGASPIVRLI